jgi:hypothetical protein
MFKLFKQRQAQLAEAQATITTNEFKDIEIVCKVCKGRFIFPATQQEYFAKRGFQPPMRCPSCLEEKRLVEGFSRKCGECGSQFMIAPGEAQFYQSRNLTLPSRCAACRARNRGR